MGTSKNYGLRNLLTAGIFAVLAVITGYQNCGRFSVDTIHNQDQSSDNQNEDDDQIGDTQSDDQDETDDQNVDFATVCAANAPAGMEARVVAMPYPSGSSNSPRVLTEKTGVFGNNEIFVVQFDAPMSELTPGAQLLFGYWTGPTIRRLATLATEPCLIATSAAPTSKILAAMVSQGPAFKMALQGTGPKYPIKLVPGKRYYLNVINRDAYNGVPSCILSDCRAFVDFQR